MYSQSAQNKVNHLSDASDNRDDTETEINCNQSTYRVVQKKRHKVNDTI